jgi:lysophospholipase L1-like esterase
MDADAQDYIDRRALAGDTLSAADQAAFNALVVELKGGGQWDNLVELWTPCGGTFTGAMVKLKDCGSGNCINTDFVSGDFNAITGLLGDGVSKRLSTGTIPSDHGVTGANIALGVFVSGTAADSRGQNIALGDGSTFFFPEFSGSIIFNGGLMSNAAATEGFHILTREAGNVSKYFHNGILMDSNNTQGPVSPAAEVTVGSYGAGFYYVGRIRCYFIATDLLEADVVAITEAFETFVGRIAASRRTGLYGAFGDSITFGLNASDAAHEYASLVATGLSLTLSKQGISGIPLYGTHTSYQSGQWSVISRICDRAPTKVTLAYGTNDVNSADTNLTAAVFQSSASATLGRIMRMCGLTGSDVTITGPTRVTSGYAGQGDDTRALAFAAAAEAAAVAEGCQFAAVRAAMISEAVTPTDGIHPDDDGHVVWADTILAAFASAQGAATSGLGSSGLIGGTQLGAEGLGPS